MIIMNIAAIQSSGLTGTQAQKIVGSVATDLTAAGTTTSTAAICPASVNVFTTVASGAGCKIGTVAVGATRSIACAGDEYIVANHGANALLVFPPTGGKFNNGTVDAAYSLPANTSILFKMISQKDAIML